MSNKLFCNLKYEKYKQLKKYLVSLKKHPTPEFYLGWYYRQRGDYNNAFVLFKAVLNKKGESLYLEYLLNDEELRNKLSEKEIRECFNYEYYTKNIDAIFKRVFKKKKKK